MELHATFRRQRRVAAWRAEEDGKEEENGKNSEWLLGRQTVFENSFILTNKYRNEKK